MCFIDLETKQVKACQTQIHLKRCRTCIFNIAEVEFCALLFLEIQGCQKCTNISHEAKNKHLVQFYENLDQVSSFFLSSIHTLLLGMWPLGLMCCDLPFLWFPTLSQLPIDAIPLQSHTCTPAGTVITPPPPATKCAGGCSTVLKFWREFQAQV